ncbi:hypothetical protein NB723_004019 [Xanthomonas sacchari]|nr:hypothetical protein [Xanthomonas sacchari]
MRRSGIGSSPPLAAAAFGSGRLTTPIQSMAFNAAVRPLTTRPLAGGSSATWSLPITTRTPVLPPWLRAASAISLPKATSMRPLPTGSGTLTEVASGVAGALSIGAGISNWVPTRSERSCSRVGGCAPPSGVLGRPTPMFQRERPCTYGLSQAISGTRSSSSFASSDALSAASKACCGSCTPSPARSASSPWWPW